MKPFFCFFLYALPISGFYAAFHSLHNFTRTDALLATLICQILLSQSLSNRRS